ncbi:MAG: hypothetical protein UR69_C0001G0034 [Candidatus Moranbacteria bacterium GW2011_GWE2_35_2-]|nr:MAG: hypothetical protein UR69_C0001G0034 [Candidatus Moranbacteria bacterium GW2011_GWE2_35_2-]KKQ22968.1 MAG: hypothetical protein US37_C0001G0240 [Candidatus Moranbacteria bacterium GW2011_GWF2_37_11]KKQ29326.1 MAG: hypothetical protein US44_C0002G0108 [Candidatus Moranbacteria bacterium GW2011_GWD1_37_17]KKQ30801.1 MAG: hypothetical protein US47_C0001G0034 [Candidatus Moranbacteria bacterium GW2011_GWE1_37_24]KKQ47996.1 MAG: hypothetical protein US66_C0003G0050 [Candidatus Moranbacteria 
METETEKKSFDVRERAKNLINDRRFELALFLILGFLLGIMLKTEASKKLTIGFDDYLVEAVENEININQIQKNAIEKQKAEQEEREKALQDQQENVNQQNQKKNVDEQECEGDSCEQ